MIQATDVLEGKTISFGDGISLDSSGVSGSTIAFFVNFTDGSSAIYTASVPEPSSALLLVIGVVGLAGACVSSTPATARVSAAPRWRRWPWLHLFAGLLASISS